MRGRGGEGAVAETPSRRRTGDKDVAEKPAQGHRAEEVRQESGGEGIEGGRGRVGLVLHGGVEPGGVGDRPPVGAAAGEVEPSSCPIATIRL